LGKPQLEIEPIELLAIVEIAYDVTGDDSGGGFCGKGQHQLALHPVLGVVEAAEIAVARDRLLVPSFQQRRWICVVRGVATDDDSKIIEPGLFIGIVFDSGGGVQIPLKILIRALAKKGDSWSMIKIVDAVIGIVFVVGKAVEKAQAGFPDAGGGDGDVVYHVAVTDVEAVGVEIARIAPADVYGSALIRGCEFK